MWQAPEIIGGQTMARLTAPIDVYAFAIVCVEIFTEGALPWPPTDDDTIRRMVLGMYVFVFPLDAEGLPFGADQHFGDLPRAQFILKFGVCKCLRLGLLLKI